MDWNHYNGPQMTPEQIHAYLDRIACPGPIPLTLAGLTRLFAGPPAGRPLRKPGCVGWTPPIPGPRGPVRQDRPPAARRAVRRAEHLLQLAALLPGVFRVQLPRQDLQSPHHPLPPPPGAGGESLPEGCYTVDVGFTLENACRPLRLEADLVQSDGACQYRYRRDPFYGWLQQRRLPGGPWTDVLGFTQEPQVDQDFAPILFYFAHSPDSNMNQFARVSRYTPKAFWPSAATSPRRKSKGRWCPPGPSLPRRRGKPSEGYFTWTPRGFL